MPSAYTARGHGRRHRYPRARGGGAAALLLRAL